MLRQSYSQTKLHIFCLSITLWINVKNTTSKSCRRVHFVFLGSQGRLLPVDPVPYLNYFTIHSQWEKCKGLGTPFGGHSCDHFILCSDSSGDFSYASNYSEWYCLECTRCMGTVIVVVIELFSHFKIWYKY